MIKLIGFRRIVKFCVLLGINLAVLGFYFLALAPMLESAQAQLKSVEGQISDLRGKISTAKQEVAFVNENLSSYQDLRDKGFFLEQDRFMIDRLLQDMRGKAGVDNFAFAVGDLREVPNAAAEGIGQKLVSSRIDVDRIVSAFDSNIYALAQDVGASFPTHTRLQRFYIRRTANLTEESLKALNEGQPVSFVSANIVFDWMTLAENPAGTGGR